MHSTTTHLTSNRVSRRGYREASLSRHLSAVTPCLHSAVSPAEPIDIGR